MICNDGERELFEVAVDEGDGGYWIGDDVEFFAGDVESEDIAVMGLAGKEEAFRVEKEGDGAAEDGERAADQRGTTWCGTEDDEMVRVQQQQKETKVVRNTLWGQR